MELVRGSDSEVFFARKSKDFDPFCKLAELGLIDLTKIPRFRPNLPLSLRLMRDYGALVSGSLKPT
jgi:hypothetical protein